MYIICVFIFIIITYGFDYFPLTLFFIQGMSKFIAASRQATGLDKTRILLEARIRELNDESKKWAEVAASAREKGKKLLNLVEELKADAVEKDTRLDHLQMKNDELSTLLSNAKVDAVAEFKSSNEYTKLLDANYVASFEDFRMEAMENFLEVDFGSIKLNLAAATNSLLQVSSEDANVEDDAITLPPKDNPKANAPQFKNDSFYFDFYLDLKFFRPLFVI